MAWKRMPWHSCNVNKKSTFLSSLNLNGNLWTPVIFNLQSSALPTELSKGLHENTYFHNFELSVETNSSLTLYFAKNNNVHDKCPTNLHEILEAPPNTVIMTSIKDFRGMLGDFKGIWPPTSSSDRVYHCLRGRHGSSSASLPLTMPACWLVTLFTTLV